MEKSLVQRIEARLLEDPSANVMALKFLSLFGAEAEGGLIEEGLTWSSWFHYPPSRFAFDARMYPSRTAIVYWNSNDVLAALSAVSAIPRGSLVKVSTEPCLSLARERGTEANAFRWFSRSHPLPTPPEPVEEFDAAHQDLVPLSAINGYTWSDLVEQERRGCRWFVSRVGGIPQALCYVQPNHGQIWEVSGVLVRLEFRGRGLAKDVVSAAVNHLVGRGLTPRYFVDERNRESLGVVRSLGLEERGRTVHFQFD